MYWKEDKTKVPREIFLRKLNEVLDKDCWIIDGTYESTMELRIEKCDTIFFLDYPVEVCIEGIMSRRGKERSYMPWVETSDEIDEEFLNWVENYNVESRPKVMELIDKYEGKEIIVFQYREEAKEYLNRSDETVLQQH